ncbi:MotA/TolQ/ExbB proton channel family protein [Akkermansia glycaniphila]|uniref:Mota/tolq/exbb proton channel family n=1 Tax=Akkermansia glycaniphila TaxID=1679444 RepID=A0A1C7PCH3_9BACT|nr:MotA/TolQ/ExbB proton channel family protein [Akkermansia glycaniphila]MBT9450139.1 MotA/TolQ/ExbB proton channel family protein [Akkermansia glycaniphila]OCA03119.1 hypothetical protein AC781_06220 [Akkermansia glycaniphila]SEH96646.1 mota/tolq/exbb proton channel family [Akkermansia glycaniphila]
MSEFITRMGPLFWVMSIFAIYGMAIIGERLFYFHRVNINSGDFLRGLSSLLRKGRYDEARHEASLLPGPTARVVEAVLSRPKLSRSDLRDIAVEATQLEVFRVEKNIRGLLVVATVTPLLGMLGTILGLVRFYGQPGILEGKLPTIEMSSAIYQALLSSAYGVALAIPAYLLYMYLAARSRKLIHKIERAALETVHIICDAREQAAEASSAKS